MTETVMARAALIAAVMVRDLALIALVMAASIVKAADFLAHRHDRITRTATVTIMVRADEEARGALIAAVRVVRAALIEAARVASTVVVRAARAALDLVQEEWAVLLQFLQ